MNKKSKMGSNKRMMNKGNPVKMVRMMNKGGAVKTPQMLREGGVTQKAMMKMNKG